MTWNPDRDAMLRRHIDKGLSSRQSAALLGCSPSAAISRAFRLNWRFQSGKKGGPSRSARAPEAVRTPPVKADALRAAPSAASPRPWLTRRAGECAYPVDGEGMHTRSCCAPCGEATYCEAHHAFMRRPTSSAEDFIKGLKGLIG